MKHYLCITDYAATGEGRTVFLSVEFEDSQSLALKNHQKRFSMHDYIAGYTDIFDIHNKRVKVHLQQFFSDAFIEFCFQDDFAGFRNNFAFEFHLNRS